MLSLPCYSNRRRAHNKTLIRLPEKKRLWRVQIGYNGIGGYSPPLPIITYLFQDFSLACIIPPFSPCQDRHYVCFFKPPVNLISFATCPTYYHTRMKYTTPCCDRTPFLYFSAWHRAPWFIGKPSNNLYRAELYGTRFS